MLEIAVLVDLYSHKKPESEELEALCQMNSTVVNFERNENGSRSLDEVSYIIAYKRLIYVQNNPKKQQK